MAAIRKMIINRNDLEFIYAEKHRDRKGNIKYLVYHSAQPFVYSEENFHSIYGEDKKYALFNFILGVEDRLIEYDIDNKKVFYVLKSFNEIKQKIKDKSYVNPSLWGYKNTFVTALSLFNSLIPAENKYDELLFEYEDEEYKEDEENIQEYQRINKKEF